MHSEVIDLEKPDPLASSDFTPQVLSKLELEFRLPVSFAIFRFSHEPQLLGHDTTVTLSCTPPDSFTSLDTLDASYRQWISLSIPPASQLLTLNQRVQELKYQSSAPQITLRSLKIVDGFSAIYAPLWLLDLWISLRTFVSHVYSWSLVFYELKFASQSSLAHNKLARTSFERLFSLPVDSVVPTLEPLRTSHLPRFLGVTWLSDENVNAGGRYVNSHPNRRPTLHVLDSFFLEQLRCFPHGAHRRPHPINTLIVNRTIHEIFIPIHSDSHWTLLHINTSSNTCSHADTLAPETVSTSEWIVTLLNRWLSALFKTTIKLKPAPLPFQIGRQSDDHSCGIAVMSTMAHYGLTGRSTFNAWEQSATYMHRLRWFLILSGPADLLGDTDKTHDYPNLGNDIVTNHVDSENSNHSHDVPQVTPEAQGPSIIRVDQAQELTLHASDAKGTAQPIEKLPEFDENGYESEDDSSPLKKRTDMQISSRVPPRFAHYE